MGNIPCLQMQRHSQYSHLPYCSLFIAMADGLVSYSMRQGDKRGNDVDFFDFTYDGTRSDNHLYNGLGQLTDGEEGDSNFRQVRLYHV